MLLTELQNKCELEYSNLAIGESLILLFIKPGLEVGSSLVISYPTALDCICYACHQGKYSKLDCSQD